MAFSPDVAHRFRQRVTPMTAECTRVVERVNNVAVCLKKKRNIDPVPDLTSAALGPDCCP